MAGVAKWIPEPAEFQLTFFFAHRTTSPIMIITCTSAAEVGNTFGAGGIHVLVKSFLAPFGHTIPKVNPFGFMKFGEASQAAV